MKERGKNGKRKGGKKGKRRGSVNDPDVEDQGAEIGMALTLSLNHSLNLNFPYIFSKCSFVVC